MSVYERELNRMQARSNKRSSGNDYTWLKLDKPARTNEQTRARLRIVPRLSSDGTPHDEFWVTVDQHILKVDGKIKVLVCPDNHDDNGGSGVCPLCKLSRDLYSSRDPAYLGLAREMSTRVRVFANVIAVDNIGDHEDNKPQIWAFSRTIHNALLDICVAKRAFIEDPDEGRDILLTTRRIGPQRIDIRYSVTDMDKSAIPDEQREIVKNAHDLESMAKPAELDELHEVAAQLDPRPAGAVSYHEPATPVEAAPVAPPAAPEAPPAPVQSAPAAPEPAPAPSGIVYHLHNANGQQEGLTAAQVAEAVLGNEGDTHNVWADGMDDWQDAKNVDEISAAVAAARPQPTKSAPPAPPAAPSGGPPSPPSLPNQKAF